MTPPEYYLALAGVFWLGIQTAICPCPLATNIAAISYIGRRVNRPRETLFSGALYAMGQVLTYLALSFLVLGLPLYGESVSGDQVTRFLTATFHFAVGPTMILIGMILANLIVFPLPGMKRGHTEKWVERFGLWSALPLGMFFTLAFCPTTAAMFLTMLVVSAKAGSVFFFPFVFSLGLSLPVVFLAVLLAFQVHWFGRAYHILEKSERFTRRAAGWIFIAIGVVLTVGRIFYSVSLTA